MQDENYDNEDEIEVDLNPDDVRFTIMRKGERRSDEKEGGDVMPSMVPLTAENEMLQKIRMASSTSSVSNQDGENLSFELERDLAEFRRREEMSSVVASGDDDGGGVVQVMSSVREVFAKILVADFFLIIGFLVWFLAASVQKEFMGNAWFLERFQDIFMPVVQPALGLLMVGSVVSGGNPLSQSGRDEQQLD